MQIPPKHLRDTADWIREREDDTPYYFKDANGKIRFVHRGEHYTLFQRKLNGSWCVKVQRAGFRKQVSTKTIDPYHAVRLAVEFIDGFVYGVAPESLQPPSFATLATVEKAYIVLANKHGLKRKTIYGNIGCLKRVLRKTNKSFASTRVSELDGKTIRDFFDYEIEMVIGQGEDERQRRLRSIKSTLLQARAIFKDSFKVRYEDAGIYIGDVSEFLKERVESPITQDHEVVDDELMADIDQALRKNKHDNPTHWVAYLLAKATLRRGEMSNAKWDWIKSKQGKTPVFKMSADQKGKRATTIPIDPDIYRELQWWWSVTEDKEYILPENGWPVDRCGKTLKSLDVWFRSRGLSTDHTFHEVRAHTLHTVREKYGEEVARRVARHKHVQTTIRHYAGEKRLPENFALN